jgi:hypothetical protein
VKGIPPKWYSPAPWLPVLLEGMSPNTPQDVEALRKKVLSNENTAAIARNLGVSVEVYTNRVVHFLLHPQQEPEIYVVEEADLRSMGLPPPDAEELGRFVTESATAAAAGEPKTEFVTPRLALVQRREPRPAPVDSSSEPTEPDVSTILQRRLGSSPDNLD